MSYIPPTDVNLTIEDVKGTIVFWHDMGIPFVKVPGLYEMAMEVIAKNDITLDDLERIKYLTIYEVIHSTHEVFNDPIFTQIKQECVNELAAMDAYYPNRKWI